MLTVMTIMYLSRRRETISACLLAPFQARNLWKAPFPGHRNGESGLAFSRFEALSMPDIIVTFPGKSWQLRGKNS